MIERIRQRFRRRYEAWMKNRLPPVRSVTLTQRRIFIFPSRQGLWFFVLLAAMLLAAINYQNNMVFMLTFLLFSIFIVTILHTYANLSGLTISAIKAVPAFAGDRVEYEISLSREGNKSYYDINLFWPDTEVATVTLDKHSEQRVRLHVPSKKRGLLNPGRLKVETSYPIGLLRSWTWITLDLEALVYPRPMKCDLQATSISDSDDGDVTAVVGSDDFYAFRSYQQGDPLKHVAWKSYAKGQSLHTKQFAAYCDQRLWLDWDQFTGDMESRLSKLCYWVLKIEQSDDEYGVKLPGFILEPANGERHQQQALRALALFNTIGHLKNRGSAS